MGVSVSVASVCMISVHKSGILGHVTFPHHTVWLVFMVCVHSFIHQGSVSSYSYVSGTLPLF